MTAPSVESHVDADAFAILSASDEERIDRIRSDKWVSYDRAKNGVDRLREIFTQPRRSRMPNLLITGLSGMGKSMIVEKFRRDHPSVFIPERGARTRPIIALQMTPSPDEGRFYAHLLRTIGTPISRNDRLIQLESKVIDTLREISPRMLVVDEIQNILRGAWREQQGMLNVFRFLTNELRISLVFLGTLEAREVLKQDEHMHSRFRTFTLEVWENNKEFHGLVGSIVRSMPLRKTSTFTQRGMKKILEVSGGVTTHIFALLEQLGVEAIRNGEEAITARALMEYSGQFIDRPIGAQ